MCTPIWTASPWDLDEPIGGLKSQLPLFFDPDMRPKVKGWMDTLRSGKTIVGKKDIKIQFHLDVDLPDSPPEKELTEPKPLTDKEREALVAYWEVWGRLFGGPDTLLGQPAPDR